MLIFLCFIILFNAVKTDTKLTLHHMGKILIILLIKIKKLDGLSVFTQETIYHVRTEMRQSLGVCNNLGLT